MFYIKPRYWKVFACVILVLATVTIYAEVRNHQFITLDDDLYITDNPTVKEGLTLQGVSWAFSTTHTGNWIPLNWLSHMVNCQLFGLNPAGHFLTNLLLHVANTLLLFLFLLRTTQSWGPSFLVAALFALHPLHVESVAWVSERKDVLSTFFWLLTMWAYVWYLDSPGVRRYLAVLICFILGMMSKSMLVTLPFVLLLLDYWPLGRWALTRSSGAVPANRAQQPYQRETLRWLILEKVPLLVLVVLFSVIAYFAQKESGSVQSLASYSFSGRLTNALVAYVSYIKMMFWPVNLAVYYPLAKGDITFGQGVGAGVLLLVLSLVTTWQSRRYPYLLVGWLWYLGTLVPVIGLVQIGDQALADRYTYVPLIGLFLIVAWGLRDLTAGWGGIKIVAPVGVGILLAVLSVCTWRQVGYWQDAETLYNHTLRITKNNYLINYNLGNSLYARGKVKEAISRYEEALRINPGYVKAQNNLGVALHNEGKLEAAISRYNEALRIQPDYVLAYYNLGLALYAQGKVDQAISHYNQALRIQPNYAKAHNDLGVAFYSQGKVDQAISYYKEALRLKSDFAEANYNLGLALYAQGKVDQAISYYNEALRIQPNYVEAHNDLGLALFAQGKIEPAIFHYNQALRIQPNHAKAHNNLGVALASQDKMEQAILHYRQALNLKPDYALALNNLAYALATTADRKFRDVHAAVQLAEKANRLTGFSQPETLDTLAAAYAAAGRFPKAVQTSQKAVDLARSSGKMDLAREIETRMRLYREGLKHHTDREVATPRKEASR